MGMAIRRWPSVRMAWTGALLAALMMALGLTLAGCQGGQGAAGDTTLYPTLPVPTATDTPRPTATPSGAAWTRVSASSAAATGMPASLRAIYQVSSGQPGKGEAPQFTLRRSDDFGQTWINLAPPTIAGLDYANDITYATTSISPLNPQVAILTLQANNGPAGCLLPSASAISGVCQAQFVTLNGGATWARLRLPAPGMLGICPVMRPSVGDIVSQGSRLYSVVNDCELATGGGNIPPGRLVASDDGGATWRLVDAALAARNLYIYTYAASPAGSDIIALVGGSNQMFPPGGTPPLSLWRSLDSGASWAQISAPGADIGGLLAASDSAGAVTFYVYAGASFDALNLYASHTGGQTWTRWSSQPVDARSAPGLLAALSNGAVLLDAASGGVEEWDGSTSAPRIVAQPTGLFTGASAALQAQPDGSTRVWLAGHDEQGDVVEYATLSLG